VSTGHVGTGIVGITTGAIETVTARHDVMITATAAIGIATTVDDLKGVTTGTTAATTKAVTTNHSATAQILIPRNKNSRPSRRGGFLAGGVGRNKAGEALVQEFMRPIRTLGHVVDPRRSWRACARERQKTVLALSLLDTAGRAAGRVRL